MATGDIVETEARAWLAPEAGPLHLRESFVPDGFPTGVLNRRKIRKEGIASGFRLELRMSPRLENTSQDLASAESYPKNLTLPSEFLGKK
jgi:hypothetical protein